MIDEDVNFEENSDTNDINLNNESDIKLVFDMFKNTSSSNDDLLKLLEAKKRLNIKDNDAIWLILIIFESYNQNFISANDKLSNLLLQFPDVLECKLNNLVENTELLLNQKLLLDIEEKSSDLFNNLIDDMTKKIKSQPIKISGSRIYSKKLVPFLAVSIFSSLISVILCLFLLIKLGFI